MHFLRVLCLSTVALAAPNLAPVEQEYPVYEPFEVEGFSAGGLPGRNRNYIKFGVQVKRDASFATCYVTTATGPIVPTIKRMVCSGDNSIVWSLEPVGYSMSLNVWWDYSSEESLNGVEHFDSTGIKNVTLENGSVVESWVGKTSYTIYTAPTSWQPSAVKGLE
ncbi:hypothetical protein CSOJ01_05158 [Colletotrichum sojae]|uniref:Uncharacterized protein n=1 Tax=Colletotrichum sojae TaxID=2175907 RepID=A0A8H6JH07_9PEZI|nr:hypothetical protein CSOJ01_05158 [Colletotrichum sojae]